MVAMDEKSVRNKLRGDLGEPIPSNIWDVLLDAGRVDEVLRGASQIEDLRRDVELLIPFRGYVALPQSVSPQRQRAATTDPTESKASFSPELEVTLRIMSMEAAHHPEVVGFRRDVLGNRLLRLEALPEWIRHRAARDKVVDASLSEEKDAGAWLSARVVRWYEEGGKPWLSPVPPWPGRPSDEPYRLSFPNPHPTRTRIAPVITSADLPAVGDLLLLKYVAAGLQLEYPWSEAQAVGFVLAGVSPRLPTLSVTRYTLRPSRIVLEVDPCLPAGWVAAAYRKAQKSLVNAKKRSKGLSTKSLYLALLAAGERETTWAETMKRWNETRTEAGWQYKDADQFARDARNALQKVRDRRLSKRTPSAGRYRENTYAEDPIGDAG